MTNTITINGAEFTRTVEMLGDVEQIRWYIAGSDNLPIHEVYDEETLEELETQYEAKCISDIMPQLPII